MAELQTITQNALDGAKIVYRATGTPDIQEGDMMEVWPTDNGEFVILIVETAAGERRRYLFAREG